jgi:hypothetical protein
MKNQEENKIVEEFQKNQSKAINFNKFGRPFLTVSDVSYEDLERIKRAIVVVSKHAMKGIEEGCLEDYEVSDANDCIMQLLSFSSKLNFQFETELLDKIHECSKKKLNNSTIEKSNNLFWLSDKNAVDPSKKEKITV